MLDRTPQDGNFLSLIDLMEGPELLYLDWFSFSLGPPLRKCMQRWIAMKVRRWSLSTF
jgi:hypothetical protein